MSPVPEDREVGDTRSTLQKAQAAAAHAGQHDPSEAAHHDLLKIAHVQAVISQAESLDRIATFLEWRFDQLVSDFATNVVGEMQRANRR